MRNPVGTHLNVGSGLFSGTYGQAVRIGAEAIQVFAGNPRAWATSAGDRRQDAALFAHPATAGVPFVLETPGSRATDDPSMPLLRKLRDVA